MDAHGTSREDVGYRIMVDAGRAISFRSIPDTWVTDYSGDMGNTFGLNGFSIGSSRQVS